MDEEFYRMWPDGTPKTKTPVVMHPDDAEAMKCPACGLYPIALNFDFSKDDRVEYECIRGHRWYWVDHGAAGVLIVDWGTPPNWLQRFLQRIRRKFIIKEVVR